MSATIKPVRCAFYIRVSTEKQLDWASLEAQEKALYEYVETHLKSNYVVDSKRHIFIDGAHSGRTDERPEFQRLMACAHRKEFDIVLVWKLDRFFRNLWKALTYLDELNNLGIGIVSTTQEFDTSGTFWKTVFNIMLAFAELESNLIKERTILWKKQKAADGKYVWGWIPPYGYWLDENRILLKNEDEAKVVKEIFQMFVSEGAGVSEIAEHLNNMKYPIRSNKRKDKKEGDPFWSTSYLYTILKNSMYYWEYYYGKTSVWKGNLSKKDLEDIKRRKENNETIDYSLYTPVALLCIPCPPLIDDSMDKAKEIFNLAQIKLDEGRWTNKRWMHKYIFSGKLYSGETGYRYTGYINKVKKTSYRLQKDKNKPNADKKLVWNISEDVMVGKVMNFFEEMISIPSDKLVELFNKYREWWDVNKDRELELEMIAADLKKLKQKKNTIYQDKLEYWMSYEDYMEFKEPVEREIEILTQRQAKLGDQISASKRNLENAYQLKKIFEEFKDKIRTLSYEEKWELCQIVVDKAYLYYSHEVYHLNFSNEVYEFFKGNWGGKWSLNNPDSDPSEPKNGGKWGKWWTPKKWGSKDSLSKAKIDGGWIWDSYAIKNSELPLVKYIKSSSQNEDFFDFFTLFYTIRASYFSFSFLLCLNEMLLSDLMRLPMGM